MKRIIITIFTVLFLTNSAIAAYYQPFHTVADSPYNKCSVVLSVRTPDGGQLPATWSIYFAISNLKEVVSFFSIPGDSADVIFNELAEGMYRASISIQNDLGVEVANLCTGGPEIIGQSTYDFIKANELKIYKITATMTPVEPVITAATFDPGMNTVTITGSNFGANKGFLSFGGYATTGSIKSWSDTQIVITKIQTGPRDCLGVYSNAVGWSTGCYALNTTIGRDQVITSTTLLVDDMLSDKIATELKPEFIGSAGYEDILTTKWALSMVAGDGVKFKFVSDVAVPTNYVVTAYFRNHYGVAKNVTVKVGTATKTLSVPSIPTTTEYQSVKFYIYDNSGAAGSTPSANGDGFLFEGSPTINEISVYGADSAAPDIWKIVVSK